jgi:hypothetical protein
MPPDVVAEKANPENSTSPTTSCEDRTTVVDSMSAEERANGFIGE